MNLLPAFLKHLPQHSTRVYFEKPCRPVLQTSASDQGSVYNIFSLYQHTHCSLRNALCREVLFPPFSWNFSTRHTVFVSHLSYACSRSMNTEIVSFYFPSCLTYSCQKIRICTATVMFVQFIFSLLSSRHLRKISVQLYVVTYFLKR